MHTAIVVSDVASLKELNALLMEEGWWVSQISPGQNGSWLVILTDVDPDKPPVQVEEDLIGVGAIEH